MLTVGLCVEGNSRHCHGSWLSIVSFIALIMNSSCAQLLLPGTDLFARFRSGTFMYKPRKHRSMHGQLAELAWLRATSLRQTLLVNLRNKSS